MRYLATLAMIGLTAASATAGLGSKPSGCTPDGCGPTGCTPEGCVAQGDCCRTGDVCGNSCCKPVPKRVDIKKTCFNIEYKTICIPPTRFPWDPDPCAGVCGTCCGTGDCADGASCGTDCAPGCGDNCGEGACSERRGLFGGLRNLLGMGLCPKARCIKTPKKSSIKCGERCVCEWKCDGPGCGDGCGNGCGDGCVPAEVPAPEQAAPVAPDAPPENAQLVPAGKVRLSELLP